MSSIEKSSTARLNARLEEVEKELAKREPLLFAEMLLLRLHIGQREKPRGKRYADLTTIGEAIDRCLKLNNGKMIVSEMLAQLTEGGYRFDPTSAKSQLRDGVNYYVETGHLQRFNDARGMAALVGYPKRKAS